MSERERNLKRRYNITIEQYDKMLEEQNGVCAICDRPERNGKFLAVDHDHETGEVRGLLCRDCNVGIGMLGELPARLLRAILYLNRKTTTHNERCECKSVLSDLSGPSGKKTFIG